MFETLVVPVLYVQGELKDRVSSLSQLEATARELESQLNDVSDARRINEEQQWKEENYQLRLKLKQAEVTADQERHLRAKISEDCAQLIEENAQLATQVSELQKALDHERAVREDRQAKRQAAEEELIALRHSERRLAREHEQVSAEVRTLQMRVEQLTADLSQRDHSARSLQQDLSDLQQQLLTTQTLLSVSNFLPSFFFCCFLLRHYQSIPH
jgi:chromosome segregation ATPase